MVLMQWFCLARNTHRDTRVCSHDVRDLLDNFAVGPEDKNRSSVLFFLWGMLRRKGAEETNVTKSQHGWCKNTQHLHPFVRAGSAVLDGAQRMSDLSELQRAVCLSSSLVVLHFGKPLILFEGETPLSLCNSTSCRNDWQAAQWEEKDIEGRKHY